MLLQQDREQDLTGNEVIVTAELYFMLSEKISCGKKKKILFLLSLSFPSEPSMKGLVTNASLS